MVFNSFLPSFISVMHGSLLHSCTLTSLTGYTCMLLGANHTMDRAQLSKFYSLFLHSVCMVCYSVCSHQIDTLRPRDRQEFLQRDFPLFVLLFSLRVRALLVRALLLLLSSILQLSSRQLSIMNALTRTLIAPLPRRRPSTAR